MANMKNTLPKNHQKEDLEESKDVYQMTNASSILNNNDRYLYLNLTEGIDSKIQLYDDYDEDEQNSLSNTTGDQISLLRHEKALSKLEKQFN